MERHRGARSITANAPRAEAPPCRRRSAARAEACIGLENGPEDLLMSSGEASTFNALRWPEGWGLTRSPPLRSGVESLTLGVRPALSPSVARLPGRKRVASSGGTLAAPASTRRRRAAAREEGLGGTLAEGQRWAELSWSCQRLTSRAEVSDAGCPRFRPDCDADRV